MGCGIQRGEAHPRDPGSLLTSRRQALTEHWALVGVVFTPPPTPSPRPVGSPRFSNTMCEMRMAVGWAWAPAGRGQKCRGPKYAPGKAEMVPRDTWYSRHRGQRGFGRGPRGVLPVQWLGRLGGWLKQLHPAASLAWRSPVLRAQGPHLGLSRHHWILPAPRD